MAALIPLLVLGSSESITYDGYWYLFIDSQNRWKLFLSEYRGNAHPIVYQLLLRLIALIGHSRLLLRCASIVPAAVSVAVLGNIAAKICRNKTGALLTAAAYGFSMVMIGINIDVRSYPLCLLFVLIGFSYFVDIVQNPSGPRLSRSLVGFGVFASLAIATEYYAIFFLFACFAYLLLIISVQSRLRSEMKSSAVSSGGGWLVAIALPLATLGFFYWSHIRYQPANYGHVAEFYWTPGSPRLAFVSRNLRADFNYILPVEITSAFALVSLSAALVLHGLYFGLLKRAPVKSFIIGLPSLMVVLLLGELITFSLLRKYPFGGFERQQSIFFPFFVLAGFVLLDQMVTMIQMRWLKVLAYFVVAFLIVVNFRYRWRTTPRNDGAELFAQQYDKFVKNVSPVEAVYVDQFSLIGYYIHTNNLKWKFYRHFREPDRVDEYRLIEPSGREFFLLRDIDQWNLNLHDPAIYQTLSRVLRDAQISRINVFLLKQVEGHAGPSEIKAEEDQVTKFANDAGLQVDSIYDDNTNAGIAFSVLPPRT